MYELLPSHFLNVCFNRLAQARGLDYWADQFASDGAGGPHQQSWSVDLDVVKRRLSAMRQAARVTSPSTGELFRFFTSPGHAPIDTWHHYFPIYEQYLARFRGRKPTVLQLGVEQGGKLEMWRAYFGAGCRLFGVDTNAAAKRHEGVADRIFIGDQQNPAFLRDVIHATGRPDVVINDGAHTANQQITAFDELYPAMSDDGVYIVEDTHTSLWGGSLMDRADGKSFFIHACHRCAELMNVTGNVRNYPILATDLGAQVWSQAPAFCRMTKEISFHDSMIVFERARRPVPRHELR